MNKRRLEAKENKDDTVIFTGKEKKKNTRYMQFFSDPCNFIYRNRRLVKIKNKIIIIKHHLNISSKLIYNSSVYMCIFVLIYHHRRDKSNTLLKFHLIYTYKSHTYKHTYNINNNIYKIHSKLSSERLLEICVNLRDFIFIQLSLGYLTLSTRISGCNLKHCCEDN